MKKLLLGSGAGLVAVALVWWVAAPRLWSDRIPHGWSWQASFVGMQAVPDPQTGRFPATASSVPYSRTVRIIGEDRPRSVKLEDRYSLGSSSDTPAWEYIVTFDVDPRTGRHTAAEFQGDVFVFPAGSRKSTYRLRFNYLKGVPMAFVREEQVEGLATYLFEYRGRGEYTEAYRGTERYPGVKVAPGQEIRCADDQLVVRWWIEPVTGSDVKIEENCLSGDVVFDIAAGRPVADVLRWGGETAGDQVANRAQAIARLRDGRLWRTKYLPAASGAAGFLLIMLGLIGRPGTSEPA